MIIGVCILSFSLFYYLYFYEYLLRRYYGYTYAIVENKKISGKVSLFYKVNNRLYHSQFNSCSECVVGESRYLIKFCTKDPLTHKIYKEYPIPDTIKNVPINGWKEIPWKVE